ncbi:MAG: hydrogen gas-evolving membrane-bound hydrogenase subunit E [bacterium]
MIAFYGVLVFMIVAAVIACEIKDLLGAVIAMGAVGFSQGLLFLMLQAPDLAITQVVVEVLTLAIFIAAISRSTRVDTTKHILPASIVGICVLILVIIGTIQAMGFLPPFGSPLMRVSDFYIKNGLVQTGAPNLVSAIILDYRGYDTLGEATVLFTATIGVLVILRNHGKKEKDK